MKFLFFTDTHIRSDNFAIRKDDFHKALADKLKEVKEIGEKEEVDYYLHGGDFFDRPDATAKSTGEFGKILQSFKKPIYGIIGNHDIYGYNLDTLERSMLGIYEKLDIIRLIDWENPLILEEDGFRIQISGAPFEYDIDQSTNYYYPDREQGVDLHILMIHSFLMDKPFIKGVYYTLIEDIADTDADIILSGHYHSGYGKIEYNDKIFVNPGALIRNSRAKLELKRRPSVVILDLSEKKKEIKIIELKSAKPGEEVMVPMDERQKVLKNLEESMKQSFREMADQKQLKIENILKEMAEENSAEQDIVEDALRRIHDVS